MRRAEFAKCQSQQGHPVGGNALRNGPVHQFELLTVERNEQSVLHMIPYTS